jgi:hypothetical protein
LNFCFTTGDVDHVSGQLIRLDHAGPTGKGIHPDRALLGIDLATAVDRSAEAQRLVVLAEAAIVRHQHDQRVLGDPEPVDLVHERAKPRV